METSGRALTRVSNVFHVLVGAHSNDALLAIEREIAPLIARHWNKIHTNAALFRRIDALAKETETLDLTAEQKRVLERYHITFRRAGAGLDTAAKKRLAEIIERLAALGHHIQPESCSPTNRLLRCRSMSEAELAGLPEFMREAMKSEAVERGLDGYAVTLSRSSVEPFLQFSARRDLREKVFRAFVMRGDNGGPTDNKAIIAETVRLRAERARLLGFADFAHYRLDDAMAKTPDAVRNLLDTVWMRARKRALGDRDDLAGARPGGRRQFQIGAVGLALLRGKAAAKTLRLRRGRDQAVSESGAHDRGRSSIRRSGCSGSPSGRAPTYRSGIQTCAYGRCAARDGKPIGLFFGDYFARPSKRSGAWMTSLRDQEKLAGDIRPLIVNVCNFSKAAEGEPTLLSFDDAHTLFHEFGHALHGLLSNVTYPEIAGTGVATDFVELPSQLYEHWLEQPDMLRRFALHYQTGEPMPEALLQRLIAARNFNRGFATVEYVACAFVDLDFHALAAPATDRSHFI